MSRQECPLHPKKLGFSYCVKRGNVFHLANGHCLSRIPSSASAPSVHLSTARPSPLGRGRRSAPGEVALNGLVTWEGHVAGRKIVRCLYCSVPELARSVAWPPGSDENRGLPTGSTNVSRQECPLHPDKLWLLESHYAPISRSYFHRLTNCRISRHLSSTLTLSRGRGWRAAPGEVAQTKTGLRGVAQACF